MRPHGTYAAYAKDKCRCAECRGYQSARNAQNRADRLAAGRLSHGRRSAYDAGCRCELCLDARRAAYPTENAAARARRSSAVAHSAAGRIHLYVLFPLTGLGAAAWGWTHSSSSPNGATVLAVLVAAVTVAIVWGFFHRWRQTDRAAEAYTKDVEARLVPDTSGEHIWDA